MQSQYERMRQMDAAANAFMQELRLLLINSKPEQREAIGQYTDLIDKHYLKAGYTRICKRTLDMRPVMK
jgi:hypothetical protein